MSWFETPWSVQGKVRRDTADWLSFNKLQKRLAPSYLYRQLLFLNEHPLRLAISLVAMAGAYFALWLVEPSLLHVPEESPDNALTYFTAVWSVQATMAALVYPIVIALVTIFLQRRPAAHAFIQLYVFHTAALVAVLSALTLVVFMSAQYTAFHFFSKEPRFIWTEIDTIWFAINAMLTAFFLYRTIDFLRPDVQAHVIRRYTVAVALPRDVRRIYASSILQVGLEKGWFGPVDRFGAQDGARVQLFSLGRRDGELQVSISLRAPCRLSNVRLWLLRVAVLGWLKRADKFPVQAKTKDARWQDWPRLVLPGAVGEEYRDEVELARVENGPPLRAWQRFLVSSAYVFSGVKTHSKIEVEDILSELVADARAGIAANDASAFDRSYEILVDLHELLIAASLFKNEDGTLGSCGMLSNPYLFFGSRLHRAWANSYRDIFQAAIDALVDEPAPIKRLCYIASRLESDDLKASPTEMREQILRLPPLMMYLLGNWWRNKAEEQGFLDSGPNRMATLKQPLGRAYDRILQDFVGGWELARERISDAEDFDWDSAVSSADVAALHISETAQMLLAAVARGDRDAAEWFADVLSKWFGSLSYESEPFAIFGKTFFLTLDHLKLPWDDLATSIGLSFDDLRWEQSSPESIKRAVFIAAIKNYWTDVRLLVLEILIGWASRAGTLKQSLAVHICAGFLNGRQWRDGGHQSDALNELTAQKYLAAKMRQYASGGRREQGYTARLDQFIQAVRDMQRPDMVSGRGYSSVGADDLGSLRGSQIALFAVLSTSAWQAGEGANRQLAIWAEAQYRAVERVADMLDGWLRQFDAGVTSSTGVAESLIARTKRPQTVDEGIARTKEAISRLRLNITQAREFAIASEPVDPQRLREIGLFASRQGFSAAGDFPLALFPRLRYSQETLEPYTLTMAQVRKGELTQREFDQRAANEESFWAATMADRVGAVVFADVLRKSKIRDLPATNAEMYWQALMDAADEIRTVGEVPILVLDNATRPSWVWDWQHPIGDESHSRPDGLLVQRVAQRGHGYICDFNDIRVYSGPLPIGQSIVLAAGVFASVTFRRFEEGRFVDVTVPEPIDAPLVDLKLKLERRVEVAALPVFRLLYEQTPTDSNAAKSD